MFQQLNQYLFQFRALTLPHFGTIRLVVQAAKLNVVEHLIYAPAYRAQFVTNDRISEHQLEYFSAVLQKDATAVEALLVQAGEALRKEVQRRTFNWRGIGTFEYSGQQIQLNPQADSAFDAVTANRVIRRKTQHAVLVGDQVVMTDGAAERVVEVERGKRDVGITAAWVLVVLAILFIAYFLYQNHFAPQASGLQIKVEPAPAAPTWQ